MKLNRKPDRGVEDREALNQLLDEQFVGVLATVVDGRPVTIPIAFVRDGDRLLFHGSTGAGSLRNAAAGAPVSFCVHTVDALRLSYNGLHHSMNYRSAVVEGTCTRLEEDEHRAALDLFVDGMVPGRTAEILPSTHKDESRTMTLALPIEDGHWLMKARSGRVARSEEAPDDVWMGEIPVITSFGDPIPADGQDDSVPVPTSVYKLLGE